MAYRKPRSPAKKGKGPSRSQQRPSLVDKIVKSRLKPGRTASGQHKKDLIKRAREHIIEEYKKKYPKGHAEDLIRKYGFGTDRYKGTKLKSKNPRMMRKTK